MIDYDGVLKEAIGDGQQVTCMDSKPLVWLSSDLFLSAQDGIQTIDIGGAADYAQYDTISGKPILRATGLNLRTVSIHLHLTHAFGIDVDNRIAALEALRVKCEPFAFYNNNKGDGFMVVMKSLNRTITSMNRDAITTSATVQIELIEYESRDTLTVSKVDKKKSATSQLKQRKSIKIIEQKDKEKQSYDCYVSKSQKVNANGYII